MIKVSIAFLFGIIVLLIFLLMKIRRRISHFLISEQDLNHNIHKQKEENDHLLKEISRLKLEIEKLMATPITVGLPDLKAPEIELDESVEVPSNPQFFISGPVDENLFSLEDKKENAEPDSLYIFSGGSVGTFEIYSGLRDFSIQLNSPDVYLRKVCDFQNNLEVGKHKSIKSLNPGKYRINENKVIVQNKTQIEFI